MLAVKIRGWAIILGLGEHEYSADILFYCTHHCNKPLKNYVVTPWPQQMLHVK